jgi:hypothetical protein
MASPGSNPSYGGYAVFQLDRQCFLTAVTLQSVTAQNDGLDSRFCEIGPELRINRGNNGVSSHPMTCGDVRTCGGIEVEAVQRTQVLQDWIRVEDYEVEAGEVRTYEFHVVQAEDGGRVTLTIKCLDTEEKTVRLDPTVLQTADAIYPQIAERRIQRLYAMGLI